MNRRRSGTAKRRPWPAEDDALLRDLYPRTRSDQLPQLLGRSHSAIKNRVAALHLRKLPEVSMHRLWTPAADELLRELYADTLTLAIAKRVGHSLSSTYQRAWKLGLSKSARFVATTAAERIARPGHRARQSQFPKGHVPANKGVRRPGYGLGRMKETQFKKGSATRWMPVGSERLVDGYRYTKVSDVRNVPWTKNWIATHILLWEKHHGALDRQTHALRFRNRDRTDVRLENLELVSRGDNMLRNTIHNLPKPLVETIQLLGALKRKINRRSRHAEQDRRPA